MILATFRKGLAFTKKNPTILYSLVLIVAISAALFFNSYYSLKKFQETADALLKSKAVLAESVFRNFGKDFFRDPALLQEKIDTLKTENSDITAIAVFERVGDEGAFRVLASTDKASVGTPFDNAALPYLIAWQDARVSSTFLSNEDGNRYWNVIRKINDEENRGLGLVLFQLSLEEHDNFVRHTLFRAYGLAILSLLFVLLLLGNHMRFFRYALKATRLEEVDHMKDDFISMASHELKTPLSVLRGYIDLLKESAPTQAEEKKTQEYLDNMDTSIVHLNALVEDILNVSRLEQNRLPIHIQSLDLLPLLSDLAKQFSLLASNKGLKFHFEPPVLSAVRGDSERIKQILVNLLGNAVKYTPGGSITLSARETEKEVILVVADTGLGLSPQSLGQLFSKFYRVKNDQTAKIAGSGLGLWIAREIARKMGGDITVESIEGEGSHFNLHLQKDEKQKKE